MKKFLIIFLFLSLCSSKDSYIDIPKYQRKTFKHWVDYDKNGLDTRQEVLKRDSLVPVTLSNKKIILGKWYDPYTNKYFTDPGCLDIDHVVSLKDAHISGAYDWTEEEKKLFANDLKNECHLIAVYKGANRSKGSKSLYNWLPKNKKYHRQYIKYYIKIKKRYGLEIKLQDYIIYVLTYI